MAVDLKWLVGGKLEKSEKKDYSWFFMFSGDGTIGTESPWRLITKEGIRVTSEDHNQLFGLKEPVDATVRVLAATAGKKVLAHRVTEQTSDLIVTFEDDVCIKFLNLSCGYEAWRTSHPSREVISLGGGKLAMFKERK